MIENKRLIQISIPFGVAIILIGFIILFPKFSRICELKVYDMKMRSTAKLKFQDKAIAERIKIVNVTDSTIKAMGWPKKTDHARMIDILSRQKAALIVYDWIFHESDNELLRAVKDSGRMLMPVLFDLKLNEGYKEYSQEVVSVLEKSLVGQAKSPYGLWHTTDVTISSPGILQHSKGIGHASARNEEDNPFNDGVYRKIALVVDFANRPIPSLVLQVVCNYLHIPLSKVQIIPGREIILPQGIFPDTGNVKDIHIPINEKGEMWIYFPGLWAEKCFELFWFENVLNKHKDQSHWPKYQHKFKDNIFFVGNASGKNKDTHIIPMEDNFPGVGIHAAALFTVLSGNFIRFTNPLIDVMIILALALLMVIISSQKPPIHASAFHLLLFIGYVAVTYWVFAEHLLNLPTVFPALTILFGGVGSIAYHFIWAEREKENLLKEHKIIQTGLHQKERNIRRLTLLQEEAQQLTEEQQQELARVKRGKEKLIKQKNVLENRLTKFKDLSLQPLREETLLEEEWQRLREECRGKKIITESKKMLDIFRLAEKAAQINCTVLILGESGTGKTLVARYIHDKGKRCNGPFIRLNPSAIPENLLESQLFGHTKGAFTGANSDHEGYFKVANEGTIFLDEIGDIPQNTQVKLLQVLDSDGEFYRLGDTKVCKTTARIIAATNREIEKAIEKGDFRDDLFYRINNITLSLPPLRERPEDIELLAKYFIDKFNQDYEKNIRGLSVKAIKILKSHPWPGNVREFENVISQAIILANGDLIAESDLRLKTTASVESAKNCPQAQSEVKTPAGNLDVFGDNGFLELLNRNKFEIGKTAKELGKGRDATRERFKGLCLKALAENEWDIVQTAQSITLDYVNLKRVENKITEYYDNTLEELCNFPSLEQLQKQIGKKYKNMPKKFHQYILRMYEKKVRVV